MIFFIPHKPQHNETERFTGAKQASVSSAHLCHDHKDQSPRVIELTKPDQNDLAYLCLCVTVSRWLQGNKSGLADTIQSYLKYKGGTLDKSDSCLPLTLCFLLPVPLLWRGPRQTQRGDRGQRRTAHCQKEGCLSLLIRELGPPLTCHAPGPSSSYLISSSWQLLYMTQLNKTVDLLQSPRIKFRKC